MKKLLSACFIVSCILMVSCTKNPDFSRLSSNLVVATNTDPNAVFGNYKTYYISDTIAYITGVKTDTIWSDNNAKTLVNAVKQNMQARGFTLVAKGANPDMGINMIAVKNISVGVAYPGWGWLYPGWWDPWYWGWYYPYYYPYTVAYSVTTGTLAFDLVDLKNAPARQQLSVLWSSVMSGALGTSNDIQNGVNAINQSFAQSPVVKAN